MKRSTQFLIGIAISFVALLVVFWRIRPSDVIGIISKGDYIYLLPAGGALLAGSSARVNGWRVLLGHDVPFFRAFRALNAGYLLNNLLPFRLGEFGRAYLVSQKQRLSGSQAFSSVAIEHLMDLVASSAILIATLPYAFSAPWAFWMAWTTIGFVAIFYIMLSVTANNQATVISLVKRVLSWLRLFHVEPWAQRVGSFIEGLKVLQDYRRLGLAAFWYIMFWGCGSLQVWFLLKIFIPEVSLVTGLFVLGVGALGAALPSSPGALGVYEASIVAALLAFGYSQATALSCAIVSHALAFMLTCLLGSLALVWEGETFVRLIVTSQSLLRSAGNPPGKH